MDGNSAEFIIIGGGVVGLTMAILLAKQGIKVEIYEKNAQSAVRNDSHDSDDESDSYPIGISSRGIKVLRRIIPMTVESLKAKHSLEIYRNTQRLASIKTGHTLEINRNALVNDLIAVVKAIPQVVMYYGHELSGIDFDSKVLHFTVNGYRQMSLDASRKRVIGADGAFSKTRGILIDHDNIKGSYIDSSSRFRDCKIIPWSYRFRVLYAPRNCQPRGLNPNHSYILSGCYTSFLKNRWSVTVGCRTSDNAEETNLLLQQYRHDSHGITSLFSPDISELCRLRLLLRKKILLLEVCLSDVELKDFYKRRVYSGVIVQCPLANYKEWILLLGDAHHAVLPNTGQGTSSGLEDCVILSEIIQNSTSLSYFHEYNRQRSKDVRALGIYSEYLNDDPAFKGERFARILFRVLEGVISSKPIQQHIHSGSYDDVIGHWIWIKKWGLGASRVLMYPIALLLFPVHSLRTVCSLILRIFNVHFPQ